MKSFKSSIRDAWERTIPEAPPFPFGDEFPVLPSGRSELLLRCAGAALIFGMLTIMAAVWGNPAYSPALQALDIQGMHEAFPRLGDYLLQNLSEVYL
ncbi:hypothetical protein [Oceanispirochaeta sp.]|uniref:hypothetical protein n=1 Tax=Oceanispirochaeta sp. TaxID=2035350 RepID=UPI00262066F5|nr:hypothetical protein [Oceanispirochaeta sp.]MDA3958314.1 hypothetical protein [Oceanispirochaeta sp.]